MTNLTLACLYCSSDPFEPEVTVSSPMLPRKERPLLDNNLNEDDRLIPKDKDKTRNSFLSRIKIKKKNAPAPPKRGSSFSKTDFPFERRVATPDPREGDNVNNGTSLSVNDTTHGVESSKSLGGNNNGAGSINSGTPNYPGPLYPRKKGPHALPGPGNKVATTPPSEEEGFSNSNRFLWSPIMSNGRDGTEWKSVTLPRDLGQRHFDSSTLEGKPALPRKRTNEQKGENARRMGTLTPPPRLNTSPDICSSFLGKDTDPSPGSSPQASTPKVVKRPGLTGQENSKTSALQAELLKANVLPALGAAGEECRARRNKHVDHSSIRERGRIQKPKPAPPPPPTGPKSGKIPRSPNQESPSSPSSSPSDIKAKGLPSMSDPSSTAPTNDQARSPVSEGTKKVLLGSKPPGLKASASTNSVTFPLSSQTQGGPSSTVASPADQNFSAFTPIAKTRSSLRKTTPRQASERTANSAVTREMVLEGAELLRAAISRMSEQTGSHSGVLEAGKNLSKYCMSYVDSIQQMRNKFAFREAITKLESSLRELQICPSATGGANAQPDFSKLLSSVKEISDIVQR